MDIELTDETLAKLKAAGWSLTGGRRSYLVAPHGTIKLPVVPAAALKLYVVHAEETSRFKIGISNAPAVRIRSMQVGSSHKLTLVRALAIDAPTVEKKAHDLLFRWRLQGEWFDLRDVAPFFRMAVARCETAADLLEALDRVGRPEHEQGP